MGHSLLDGKPTAAQFGGSVLQLNITSSRYDAETNAASDQVGALQASGSVIRLFASGSDLETSSLTTNGLTASLYFLKPSTDNLELSKPARVLGHNIDETISGGWTYSSTLTAQGLANLDGGIEIDNSGNKFTVSTAGAVMAAGLSNLDGGIEVDSGGNKFTVSTAGVVVAAGKVTGDEFATDGNEFTVSTAGAIVAASADIDDVQINGATIGHTNDTSLITLANNTVTFGSDDDVNISKTSGLQLGGAAVTSTAAELNLLDEAVANTVVNSKAVIYGSSGEIKGGTISGSALNIPQGTLSFNGQAVSAEASELNLLDGSSAGTVVASKAAIYSAGGALTASSFTAGTVEATYAQIDHLDVNTINSVTKTVNTLEVADKYIVLASGSTGGNVNGAGIAFGGHGSGDGMEGPTAAAATFSYDDTVKALVASGSSNMGIHLSASGDFMGTGVKVAGRIFGSTLSLNAGSNEITAAELNVLDAVTPGTAVASKAVVLDSNKDIGTIRNLTIDGVFTDGNYTFDTSGNVTGLGTVGCGAITSTGNFSAVGTITGDTSLTLDSTTITTAEIGVLDTVTPGTAAASKAMVLDSDADISGGRNLTISGELDAATLDISSTGDVAGTLTCSRASGTGLAVTSNATISGDLDVDGTTNLDAVDIDGAVQIDNTVTVGVDDTGYDVKFFGGTSGAYMLWDQDVDDLKLVGAAGLIVPEGQFTLGSTAVTATAAELNDLAGNAVDASDFTKLSNVTSTAAELNLLDTAASAIGRCYPSKAAVFSSSGSLSVSAIFGHDLGSGVGLSLDYSTCGSNTGKIMLKDNLANALEIQQGVGGSKVSYLKFVSTDNSESVDMGVDLNLADGASVTADAFVLNSDETLKKDIKTLDSALDKVMSMRGVTYQFKHNPEKQEVGFLAQEMKNSVPEVVSTTNKGTLGIDYAKLTSVLVEAVKEQQEQIEELKAKLSKDNS